MARVNTCGFQRGSAAIENCSFAGTGTAPAFSTDYTLVQATCVKCNSGAGAGTSRINVLGNLLTQKYFRAMFLVPALPTQSTVIMAQGEGAYTNYSACTLESDGTIKLRDKAGTVFGTSTEAVVSGQKFTVEMYMSTPAVGATLEARLNFASFATGTLGGSGAWVSSRQDYGLPAIGTRDANFLIYVANVASNSTAAGGNQTSWPGPSQTYTLFPASDNNVGTGWTDGDGAGTLFGALDNAPPVGATTPADQTQIKNASSSSGRYDANLATLASLGVSGSIYVEFIQMFFEHGEAVATGAKTGTIELVSNPVQAAIAFTYGGDVGQQGAWPTNWASGTGAAGTTAVVISYTPTIDPAVATVIGIAKDTGTTRDVGVCALGAYVELWLMDEKPIARGLARGLSRGLSS